jgi:hypothetical protein
LPLPKVKNSTTNATASKNATCNGDGERSSSFPAILLFLRFEKSPVGFPLVRVRYSDLKI